MCLNNQEGDLEDIVTNMSTRAQVVDSGDNLLHHLFLDGSISSGPWTRCRSVCSRWSTVTTCTPPSRTCSRRASWCGPSAGSTSTPSSAYLSTWSSASSSPWSPTPMTPSKWGENNHCGPGWVTMSFLSWVFSNMFPFYAFQFACWAKSQLEYILSQIIKSPDMTFIMALIVFISNSRMPPPHQNYRSSCWRVKTSQTLVFTEWRRPAASSAACLVEAAGQRRIPFGRLAHAEIWYKVLKLSVNVGI